MQTNLAEFVRDTPEGREADSILRKCVHCGFCLATCPTYQLLGDELDGPRGRIYLIKQVLEGQPATEKTRLHLDRCLTCRSCETTCPSGVQYGRLLDLGRHIVEQRLKRAPLESLTRAALRTVIPNPALFTPLLSLGQVTRPLLPGSLKRKVPPSAAPVREWPQSKHQRKMLVLEGCVQPGLSPATNAAAARVLDRLEISLVRARGAGCCGAVSYHLSAHDDALLEVRRNINAWWTHVEQGVEAIVMTASGCGTMVKDYGYLLSHDPEYAEKARKISDLTLDISEILIGEREQLLTLGGGLRSAGRGRVAFHAPCSLQHGLKLKGKVEALLVDLGFDLVPAPDSHLCCGSAGTYSILQPEISQRLLTNKIKALIAESPSCILTANIGCQLYLQTATNIPVRHWVEALDEALPATR